ncbi:MAG: hypothetical protein K0S10_1447 [Rubrobacteraceae bacterium]|jgi:adenylate kinase family enzyme|nr:hypothetical protein [Rubrobacteraceae bacterium]
MTVAFIGPVGAGKTTQAQRLALALPNYVDAGPFERREDDAEIRHHLGAHRGDFAALKERYEARGLLSVVDAGRSIDEVADDVLEVLGHPERPAFYALGR